MATLKQLVKHNMFVETDGEYIPAEGWVVTSTTSHGNRSSIFVIMVNEDPEDEFVMFGTSDEETKVYPPNHSYTNFQFYKHDKSLDNYAFD